MTCLPNEVKVAADQPFDAINGDKHWLTLLDHVTEAKAAEWRASGASDSIHARLAVNRLERGDRERLESERWRLGKIHGRLKKTALQAGRLLDAHVIGKADSKETARRTLKALEKRYPQLQFAAFTDPSTYPANVKWIITCRTPQREPLRGPNAEKIKRATATARRKLEVAK